MSASAADSAATADATGATGATAATGTAIATAVGGLGNAVHGPLPAPSVRRTALGEGVCDAHSDGGPGGKAPAPARHASRGYQTLERETLRDDDGAMLRVVTVDRAVDDVAAFHRLVDERRELRLVVAGVGARHLDEHVLGARPAGERVAHAVELLARLDRDAQKMEMPPLLLAAYNGDASVVGPLLTRGDPYDQVTARNNQNVLHLAAGPGDERLAFVVAFLDEVGFDWGCMLASQKQKDGVLPMARARQNRHRHVAELCEALVRGDRQAFDGGGDLFIPGVIDLHTDALEGRLMPRPGVDWPGRAAMLAHDSDVIGAGVTTSFNAVAIGTSSRKPERMALIEPFVQAVQSARAEKVLRADHRLHFRCEVTDPLMPETLEALLERVHPDAMSIMDHAPGKRQVRDVEDMVQWMVARRGETADRARHIHVPKHPYHPWDAPCAAHRRKQ